MKTVSLNFDINVSTLKKCRKRNEKTIINTQYNIEVKSTNESKS